MNFLSEQILNLKQGQMLEIPSDGPTLMHLPAYVGSQIICGVSNTSSTTFEYQVDYIEGRNKLLDARVARIVWLLVMNKAGTKFVPLFSLHYKNRGLQNFQPVLYSQP